MEPKIAIGIPHLGNLPGYFVDSLMFMRRGDMEVNTVRVENKPIDTARNRIAKAFVEAPAMTHLFFMDADMVFHKDTLLRLLAHDLPIVSGTYFARTDTPIPHVYKFSKVDEHGVTWYSSMATEFVEWVKRHPEQDAFGNAMCFPGDALVECDGVGFGCVLIKREVFEALEYPYFEADPETGGAEDFDFCEKARAAGFKVWADFSVQANHEARGGFIGREEFMECFAIGTPDEHNFAEPISIEVRPDGQRRVRPNRRNLAAVS